MASTPASCLKSASVLANLQDIRYFVTLSLQSVHMGYPFVHRLPSLLAVLQYDLVYVSFLHSGLQKLCNPASLP